MSVRGLRLTQGMAPEVQQLIYRPRLDAETATSLDHMHAVNQAHLLMLLRQKLISGGTAALIAREMLALEDGGRDTLPNDPALEDLYFNWESALIARTSVEIGGALHIGRSRNDIGATIDRMRARQHAYQLVERSNIVRAKLLDLAVENMQTVMPGYTHLQPSQPMTFGFYLLGVATALGRDVQRILTELPRINCSPLGACAMAGTSFPIDRGAMAELLAFSSIATHAQDAVASRDYMLALGASGASLAMVWSRFAQDIYVWASAEFGLVELADSISGVSSIMPQKKNPIVLEALKANAGTVIGDYTSMLATMRATHFTHSIDATRASLGRAWALLDTADDSLRLMALVVASIRPCVPRMRKLASENFSTLTDIAEHLVQQNDISFREAHHVAGHLSREAIDRGLVASQIDAAMLSAAFKAVTGKSEIFEATTVADLSNPEISIGKRDSMGGPASQQVEKMIIAEREGIANDDRVAGIFRVSISLARKALRAKIASLAADTN